MLRIAIADFLFYMSTAALYPYLQLTLRNNGYSHGTVGVMLAIGEAASVVIPLLVANLADRTGRKRLAVLFCGLLSALLFVPVTQASVPWVTIVTIFLCRGVYSSLNPLLDSIATNYFNGDPNRYSQVRTVGTLGYVLACLFYGASSVIRADSNLSILRAFMVTALVFSLYCLSLPKVMDGLSVSQRARDGRFHVRKVEPDPGRPKYGTPFQKAFGLLLLATFFIKFGNSVVDRLLSSYMTEVMGLGDSFINYVALGSATEMVVMLCAGKLMQKKGVQPVVFIIGGGLLLIGRLMIYNFTTSIGAFVCAQMLHGFTFGGVHVASIRFIASKVPRENSSMAMSVYTCIGSSLPTMLGSLSGGWIIEEWGYHVLFCSFAAVVGLGVLVMVVFHRQMLCQTKPLTARA